MNSPIQSLLIAASGEDTFEVVGNLTMIGNAHPVTLQVEFLGEGPGNRESTISGWDLT